jgi:hypothetical protein
LENISKKGSNEEEKLEEIKLTIEKEDKKLY